MLEERQYIEAGLRAQIADLEAELARCAAGPWRTDVENAEHGKQYIVILDGFFGGEPRALWCDSESASDPCWREYREGPVVAWQDSTVAFAHLAPWLQPRTVTKEHVEQMKQLQSERDYLAEQLLRLRGQRILSGLRNAKRWFVPAFSETKISISEDNWIDSNDEYWRDDVVIAHNNDVTALNHCCDVITEELSGLNKRLEALYESINVQDDSLFAGGVDLGYLETCEMAQEAAENLKDAIRQAIDGTGAEE
jgi:hypothetical protein